MEWNPRLVFVMLNSSCESLIDSASMGLDFKVSFVASQLCQKRRVVETWNIGRMMLWKLEWISGLCPKGILLGSKMPAAMLEHFSTSRNSDGCVCTVFRWTWCKFQCQSRHRLGGFEGVLLSWLCPTHENLPNGRTLDNAWTGDLGKKGQAFGWWF